MLGVIGFMTMGILAWGHHSIKRSEVNQNGAMKEHAIPQSALIQKTQKATLKQIVTKANHQLGTMMIQHSNKVQQNLQHKKGIKKVIMKAVTKTEKTIGNSLLSDKSLAVAIVLWFFLGGLAIHRVYLGTDPLMILWYFLTIGGIFGLCPLLDLITMIIDFDAMIDNNKFFSIAAL